MASNDQSTAFIPKAEAEDIRQELCFYAARLKSRGLTSATGGNLSYRLGEKMWISPSGCALDELSVDDWVLVDVESGQAEPHRFIPSSETLMHRLVYLARPDVCAIMHSHPPHVIALSLVGLELKPIGSEAPILLGERIPLVPYEMPTSPMLAEAAAHYAKAYEVLVLQNHGLLTLGSSNRQAYLRTELAEEIARIMCIAYGLGMGQPRWPSEEQLRQYREWHFEGRLPQARSGG
jgi:L-fuculose-phosphate aldolase